MWEGGFPSAEDVARTVVLSALFTGELPRLMQRPEILSDPATALRARWIALDVLCALHLRVPAGRLGRLVGASQSPLFALRLARGHSWWSQGAVDAVFRAVALAGPGESIRVTAGRVMGELAKAMALQVGAWL